MLDSCIDRYSHVILFGRASTEICNWIKVMKYVVCQRKNPESGEQQA